MGFFGSLTGSDQRKDMREGFEESTRIVNQGYDNASGRLQTGYNRANNAYTGARNDVMGGYRDATNALRSGTRQAVSQFQPYAQSGRQANALYSNALGLNGQMAQTEFMNNYQADPFRDANAQFASNALMQVMNARGLSGSGTAAAAVSQENLRRGSEDYNNYLNRLSGVASQGMTAAGQIAGLQSGQGDRLATLATGRGTDLANITGQRAGLAWNNATGQAGLDVDRATTNAGNRINFANSMANSRGILANNLMSLAGLGIQAYTGMGKK